MRTFILQCLVFLLLCADSRGTSPPSIRRLVTGGTAVTTAASPFMFTIMSCEAATSDSPDLSTCAGYCVGTLITPNAGLTAASCLVNRTTGAYSTPLAKLYVLVGSTNRLQLETSWQLVKVDSVSTHGYGSNSRFILDNDVAIVFLARCLVIQPGVIETVTLATSDFSTAACESVKLIGNGRSNDLPSSLYTDSGNPKYIQDVIHATSVCQAVFKDQILAQNGASVGLLTMLDQLRLNATILGDMFMCSGGNTLQSMCFGDAGSPILKSLTSTSDKLVQVGIASFLPSGGCGYGPEYSTRVAFHAEWISQQLTSYSQCAGWTLSQSFSSWPVPSWPSSADYLRTRCSSSSQWQCVADGECISSAKVCDGTPDCADSSDETPSMCQSSTSSRRLLSIPLQPVVNALVACSSTQQTAAVQLLGSTCNSQVIGANSSINMFPTATSYDTGLAEVTSACNALVVCIQSGSSSTFASWYSLTSTCSMSTAIWKVVSVCSDLIIYSTEEAAKVTYANAFNSKYGASCDSTKNQAPGGQSNSASSSLSLSGAGILVILICLQYLVY